MKRELANEVEFITIMLFDSLSFIKEFVGDAYEKSVVPDKAQKILSRYDQRSQHYEYEMKTKCNIEFLKNATLPNILGF